MSQGITKTKLDHPFLQIADSLDNRFLRKAGAEGKKVIGFFCNYVPRELLDAGGAVPFRMRTSSNVTLDVADTYLGIYNCSYTRCMLESIMDDTLDFVDGYVFAASCDHLRRLYDNLRYLMKPALCHILDLPHKTHEAAIDWYRDELILLKNAMEKSLGIIIDDAEVSRSIALTNELRKLLKKIQDMRKLEAPKLTGEEMHRIMMGVNSVPAKDAIEQLKELYQILEEREPVSGYRARLLIMGSQMDDPQYIGTMEEMGALIVGDAFCEGSIQFTDEVSESGDPYMALASRYLKKMSCPRMFEAFDERYSKISGAVRDYRADGVIMETMKFCDTWGIDGPLVLNRLRDEGVEVLKLEREYIRSGVGQLRTRVQAFLEMLGK